MVQSYSWIQINTPVHVKWKNTWRAATITEMPQLVVEDWTVLVSWTDTKRMQTISCEDCQPLDSTSMGTMGVAPTTRPTITKRPVRDPSTPLHGILRSPSSGGQQCSGCSVQESPISSEANGQEGAAVAAERSSPLQQQPDKQRTQAIAQNEQCPAKKVRFALLDEQAVDADTMIPTGISTRESAKQRKPPSKFAQLQTKYALRSKVPESTAATRTQAQAASVPKATATVQRKDPPPDSSKEQSSPTQKAQRKDPPPSSSDEDKVSSSNNQQQVAAAASLPSPQANNDGETARNVKSVYNEQLRLRGEKKRTAEEIAEIRKAGTLLHDESSTAVTSPPTAKRPKTSIIYIDVDESSEESDAADAISHNRAQLKDAPTTPDNMTTTPPPNLKRAAVGKERNSGSRQGSTLKETPIPVVGASRKSNTGNSRATQNGAASPIKASRLKDPPTPHAATTTTKPKAYPATARQRKDAAEFPKRRRGSPRLGEKKAQSDRLRMESVAPTPKSEPMVEKKARSYLLLALTPKPKPKTTSSCVEDLEIISAQLTALYALAVSSTEQEEARKLAAKKNAIIDLTADSDDDGASGEEGGNEEEANEESDKKCDGQGRGRKRRLFVARKIAESPMRGHARSSSDEIVQENDDKIVQENDDEIVQDNHDDDDEGSDAPMHKSNDDELKIKARQEITGFQGSDAPTHTSNDDELKIKARQEIKGLQDFWQASAEALEEKEQVEIEAAKSPENFPVHSPTRRSERKMQTPAQRDLDLRRRFFTTFHVCSGTDQCDPEGVGCLARRHINKGEEFIDPYATYKYGAPPGKVACTRGSYIKTKEGYFDLVPSATEWINAPSHGREANVNFRSRYDSICGDGLSPFATKKLLVWKAVRPIDTGEEILAEYGGVEFDDAGSEYHV